MGAKDEHLKGLQVRCDIPTHLVLVDFGRITSDLSKTERKLALYCIPDPEPFWPNLHRVNSNKLTWCQLKLKIMCVAHARCILHSIFSFFYVISEMGLSLLLD